MLTITLPDGSVSQTAYAFGSDRQQHPQFSTKTTATTSFQYDMFGRRTSRQHPDEGLSGYSYDLAGNMTRVVTANLQKDSTAQAGKVSKKTGMPKGDAVIRIDQPHGKVTNPHINLNEELTGMRDPHTPISSTTLKTLGTAGRVLEGAEKVATPVAIVIDAVQLGVAIKTDVQQKTLNNTVVASTRIAGGWVGATAGASAGAQGGAAVGAFIGSIIPGAGTVVGGAVGGFIGGLGGGIIGAIWGSNTGESLGKKLTH